MNLPRRRVYGPLLLILGLFSVGISTGQAVDLVHLKLGTLTGAGWTAQDVAIGFSWLDDSHASILLRAQSVSLPAAAGTFSDLVLTCDRVIVTAVQLECAAGTLQVTSSKFGHQALRISWRYQLRTGSVDARVQDFRLAGGRLAITASLDAGRWQLNTQARGLSLQEVSRELSAAGHAIPMLEGSGRIDLTAKVSGHGAQPGKVTLEIHLQADEFSNTDGSVAGENLNVLVRAELRPKSAGWHVELDITGRKGALYVDPVFVEVPVQPVRATASLDWFAADSQLVLHAFKYSHPGSVQLVGNGRLYLAADGLINTLKLDIQDAVFPSLYETYLQPWLIDTALGDLDTTGHLSGQLQWQQGALGKVRLEPVDVSLDDREGRFGLQNINGLIRWSDTVTPERSEIEWDSGSIFRVGLGHTGIVFASGHNYVHLLKAAKLPVLDGVLEIDEFDLEYSDDAPLRWQVNAYLTPVSLPQLSHALGWPALAGKLSGVIPNVRYDGGNLEVGGILLLRVFDGEITLRNLKLARPFGLVPRLQVDARADNIDLETLTRIFSFGRIEGRLNGRIDGLDMQSWRPVAFDAEFATPLNDSSRHRISQKAVDNISSIGGGGVGGALSRGLLGFFEDFPYNRLGIRCRLANGICEMDGVAPAENGYYLVKGRFIPPRLDVIGYADRVDWATLLAQIIAVTGDQDVIVE